MNSRVTVAYSIGVNISATVTLSTVDIRSRKVIKVVEPVFTHITEVTAVPRRTVQTGNTAVQLQQETKIL